MKLEGDYIFEAPLEEVWKALMDPAVLAAVMPGCDKLELVDGHYVGELNIKVGPIQGKFAGKVDLKDVVEPKSYSLTIDGHGAPGFVKATARVVLREEGSGTKLVYDADAQVGGKIASIGQRLLDASAKAIAKQSLEGLHENIKVRHRAHAQKPDQPPASPEAAAEPRAAEAPEAPPPVVKTSQAKLAASVAKEVSKSLLPAPVVIGAIVVIALLLAWLLLRR